MANKMCTHIVFFVIQFWNMVGVVSWIHAAWQENWVQFAAWARDSYLLWSMELATQWGRMFFEWGQVTRV